MSDEVQNETTNEVTEETGFTPITSQRQLDRILGGRLAAERSKFSDYEDLKAKAAKFDEAEEAAKSDLEKAIARAEEAEKKAQSLEAAQQVSAWRAQVSKDSGIPADVLRGSTLEELEAHAESLKSIMAPPEGQSPVPTIGSTPEPRNVTLDEQIAAAEKAGDYKLSATLKAQKLGSTN